MFIKFSIKDHFRIELLLSSANCETKQLSVCEKNEISKMLTPHWLDFLMVWMMPISNENKHLSEWHLTVIQISFYFLFYVIRDSFYSYLRKYLARSILMDFTDEAPKHKIKSGLHLLCTVCRSYLPLQRWLNLLLVIIYFFTLTY